MAVVRAETRSNQRRRVAIIRMLTSTPFPSAGMPMGTSSDTVSPQTPARVVPRIGLFAGPLALLVFVLLPPPDTVAASAWLTLGLLLLMAIWWATEAIPMPVTSLLPIVLVPILGLGTIESATSPYANHVIFL